MLFAASWNHTTKFSTTCAMLTLLILPGLLAVWDLPFVLVAGSLFIEVLIGVVSWGYGPQAYEVGPDGIRVLRPLEKVLLKAADIEQVKAFEKADLGVPIRFSGNGGLFGFYGRYYSRKLGWHHWYASRSAELTGVKTAAGWVILSPDDRAGFVEAVAAIAPHSTVEECPVSTSVS